MAPTTRDITFDLLKNSRRRRVLDHLLTADGPVELEALAEQVAAGVDDQSATSHSEDVEATYLSLVHSHLPRLEDAGVLMYDAERSTVALTRRAGSIEPFLSLATRLERNQS